MVTGQRARCIQLQRCGQMVYNIQEEWSVVRSGACIFGVYEQQKTWRNAGVALHRIAKI